MGDNETIFRVCRGFYRTAIICTFIMFGSVAGCTGTVAWLLTK